MKSSSEPLDLCEYAVIADNGDERCGADGGGDDADDQYRLDLEVKQFLERESYRGDDVERLLGAEDYTFLEEEMLLMDVNESIDVPDLDFSDLALTEEEVSGLDSQKEPVLRDETIRSSPPNATVSHLIRFAPPPPGRQRQTPNQTTSRKRAKYEMEYLRQQAKELEHKLTQLKHDPTDGGESDDQVDTPEAQLWKRIAEQQMNQQRKSEVENRKLKDLLERQLKIAHKLSKAIRKQSVPNEGIADFNSRSSPPVQQRVASAARTTVSTTANEHDTSVVKKRHRARNEFESLRKPVAELEEKLRRLGSDHTK